MADIVLKDRNGSPVEYPGVERIKVNTVDGEAVEFVDSATIPEVLENLPITLDFSGGNQTATAPDGMVVKSAIIQQPANLIPENIAEGVDIAGIIGTLALAAGGGKVATGTLNEEKSSAFTIAHNLGVVPDFALIVKNDSTFVGYYQETALAFGISSALRGKLGSFRNWCVCSTSAGKIYVTSTAVGIESGSTVANVFKNATATEITFSPSSNYPIKAGTQWLAIGGLT